MKAYLACLAAVAVLACQPAAEEQAAAAPAAEQAALPPADGQQLEQQMWADMVARNWSAVEARMADHFQSVHTDGARDKAGEMALIRGLDIAQPPELTDWKVTQNGDALIVTYAITTQETINGKVIDNRKAMRLSVWQRIGSDWKWISHVNLAPVG